MRFDHRKLVRCESCRSFLLDTDIRCWHCGVDQRRSGYWLASGFAPVTAAALIMGAVVLGTFQAKEVRRLHDRERLNQPSDPGGQFRQNLERQKEHQRWLERWGPWIFGR